MRLRLLALLLALAIGASTAAAQEGIQLSWNDCGTFGSGVQTFACNSNSGTAFRMIGSARLNATLDPLVTIISTLDVSVDATSLPAWWQVHNAGACRQSAVAASVHVPGPGACAAWENNTTLDAFMVQDGYGGPSHTRWDVLQFGDANNPVAFPGGVENFLFSISINRSRTVGAGSCSGCPLAACVTLRRVEFRYGSFPTGTETVKVVTTPLTSFGITWQSVAPSCLGAVPAPRATWSDVKALYR